MDLYTHLVYDSVRLLLNHADLLCTLGSTRCVFVHRIRLPPLLPHPAPSSKLPQKLYTSIMDLFRIITDRRNPRRSG